MVDQELVKHSEVVGCFTEVIDFKMMSLTRDEFLRYRKNLHTVGRDMFGEPESEIDEPSWLR